MTDDTPGMTKKLFASVTAHLRVALIAVVFGMTAYGLIHALRWAIDTIGNM